jgi:UDPglucose 6-dehydrogenase
MGHYSLTVCVVGTGYVGLTTGVCLAAIGHKVTCIDVDSKKVERLCQGKSPIYEPGIEELLRLAAERLTFTTSFSNCCSADVIILAVGTPPKTTGKADLSYIEAAAAIVAENLRKDKLQVIVNKSTVPIGTARRVKLIINQVIAEKGGPKPQFAIVSNPEFLREGSAVHDTLYPDRIVVGGDDVEEINVLRTMYTPILEQTFTVPECCTRPEGFQLPTLVTTDGTSAEMIKYAANAFLATKISFINEIGGLCEKVGADVAEVARGVGLDKRIGSRFLQAGLGWGGSCFGKDMMALSSIGGEYGYAMPILESAVRINRQQRVRVIEKLQESLKVIRGRTIGILGLAFKPNTDDLRDAPAINIIEALLEMGCQVKVYDPVAMDNLRRQYPDFTVEYCENPLTLAENCDAVVLVTEWDEFSRLPLEKIADRMNGEKVLVDGRNILKPLEAQAAGMKYIGFGR